MTIAATLGVDASQIHSGGGNLWIVEHDAAKIPQVPYATLDAAAIATATTLSCHHAVTGEFGATGDLNIDVTAKDAAAEEKAFSALSSNDFTISALTTGRSAGCLVKLKSASDYGVTDWKNLGHLADSGTEFQDSVPTTYDFNELKEMVKATAGERTIQFISGLLQTSRDMIDFLRDEARTKNFAVRYIVPLVGKGHQVYIAEYCQIIPDLKLKFGKETRNIPITIAVLKRTGTSTELKLYEG